MPSWIQLGVTFLRSYITGKIISTATRPINVSANRAGILRNRFLRQGRRSGAMLLTAPAQAVRTAKATVSAWGGLSMTPWSCGPVSGAPRRTSLLRCGTGQPGCARAHSLSGSASKSPLASSTSCASSQHMVRHRPLSFIVHIQSGNSLKHLLGNVNTLAENLCCGKC